MKDTKGRLIGLESVDRLALHVEALAGAAGTGAAVTATSAAIQAVVDDINARIAAMLAEINQRITDVATAAMVAPGDDATYTDVADYDGPAAVTLTSAAFTAAVQAKADAADETLAASGARIL